MLGAALTLLVFVKLSNYCQDGKRMSNNEEEDSKEKDITHGSFRPSDIGMIINCCRSTSAVKMCVRRSFEKG